MIRDMIKKALGVTPPSAPEPPPTPRPTPAAGAPGLMQMGRKPEARPREGLPLRAQDTDVTAWLEQAVAQNGVLIFMKGTPSAPACGFSARVVEIFKGTGVPFQTYNILEDAGVREGIKAWNNWPTLPQVFIGGEFVGGCDIVTQMAANGELKQALDGLAKPA